MNVIKEKLETKQLELERALRDSDDRTDQQLRSDFERLERRQPVDPQSDKDSTGVVDRIQRAQKTRWAFRACISKHAPMEWVIVAFQPW